MGNFITYGATETLDNDQKFIIDSDRTGPGSITAKDAASSLLSKWAGFETFEEAVQNTISNNQEFIDRDAAIRSETADLKKKIVTTFPAKDASGAVATFESEFEDAPLKSCIVRVEPVQDLHGYDSPWVGGGGKNLFDADTIYAEYRQSDGSFVGTGNNVSRIHFNIPESLIGKELTFSGYMLIPSDSTMTNCRVAVVVNGSQRSGNYVTGSTYVRTSITFTPTSVDDYVQLTYGSNGGQNFQFKELQLEIGSTATSYAPYENICPITGWTGANIQHDRKNLLPLNIWGGFNYNASVGKVFTPTMSDKSWTQGESSITYETTATYTTLSLMTPLLHKGTYHFSLHKLSTNSLRYSRYTLDKSFTVKQSDYISNVTNVSVAITLDEDGYIAFYLDNGSTASQTVEITIQVEVGDTESTYEPYTGRTYPITFPTEAGTVYGAYVDVTGGELVVDRAMVDLGMLTWTYQSSQNRYFSSGISTMVKAPKTNAETIKALSSNYKYMSLNQLGISANEGCAISTTKNVYVKDYALDAMDVASFKTAMSGVQLVYELAEPIHYPLTPQEIKTLLGQNNIWSNTGDTAVEYLMSDVSWYVEKKLKAFQSVLAGVEDSAVASKNYSANTYLIFNDDIYRVTKTITAGETIEEGVNVTKTTVAEQLMALAQA